MYRIRRGQLEFLIGHPGGPFFKDKDENTWSIPKGELHDGEDTLKAAEREFEEETSIKPKEPYIPLGSIEQTSGKIVHAWAFERDVDPTWMVSNEIEMEWPPHSGKTVKFPEIDQFEFLTKDKAMKKLRDTQHPFLERLEENIRKALDA